MKPTMIICIFATLITISLAQAQKPSTPAKKNDMPKALIPGPYFSQIVGVHSDIKVKKHTFPKALIPGPYFKQIVNTTKNFLPRKHHQKNSHTKLVDPKKFPKALIPDPMFFNIVNGGHIKKRQVTNWVRDMPKALVPSPQFYSIVFSSKHSKIDKPMKNAPKKNPRDQRVKRTAAKTSVKSKKSPKSVKRVNGKKHIFHKLKKLTNHFKRKVGNRFKLGQAKGQAIPNKILKAL